MAARRPLVLLNGTPAELPLGDTLADGTTGLSGGSIDLFKVGTAPEAAGVWYSFAKDSGFPGAWSPGTPGMAGRATSGTTAEDAGCLPIANAATGTNYLTEFGATCSVAGGPALYDVLWVNSGAVVITITAQTVASVTLPARDADAATSGRGCVVGVLVTAATTNAAAIANMTLSYRNSAGVAGRTATMTSFPATAVVGTVAWFQLQAGDVGVQSVQSWTLGTTLLTGTVSLIIARKIDWASCVLAAIPSAAAPTSGPGVRLASNVCLLPMLLPSSASAVTINGCVKVVER